MKNERTETALKNYSLALDKARQSLPPVVEDDNTPEMTDADADALVLSIENDETDRPVPETYARGVDLLEAIKSEIPYFQQVAEENGFAFREEQDEKEVNDKGLTTAINTSTSLVSISDTMENIAALFARHPYGYKHGSRDSKGRVVHEPFTAAENEAAEKWAQEYEASGKAVPATAEEEAD